MGRWHHEPLRQRQSRWSSEDQNALDAAIGALIADELRTFLRAYVADLEEPARTIMADALVERAARGSSGGRPSVTSKKIVVEVSKDILPRAPRNAAFFASSNHSGVSSGRNGSRISLSWRRST